MLGAIQHECQSGGRVDTNTVVPCALLMRVLSIHVLAAAEFELCTSAAAGEACADMNIGLPGANDKQNRYNETSTAEYMY